LHELIHGIVTLLGKNILQVDSTGFTPVHSKSVELAIYS
jgi:hypothetical protein